MKCMERLMKWWKRNSKDGAGGGRIVLLLGLSAMALLLLSELLPKSGNAEHPTKPAMDRAADCGDFVSETESRLALLLSEMDGVGQATVMVSVSGTAEQVYAEEVRASQNGTGRQSETALVITRSNGSESALVAQTRCPEVTGVAVLCTGGGSAAVQERVIRAVSTVMGIPTSRVFVGRQIAAPIS